MTVAVIDYGSGNLHSAAKALERAARESGLNETIEVTRDPEKVRRADRVVLPGVGAFADCKAGLVAVPGMIAAMTEAVRDKGRPFFGICVGMQLLADSSEEGSLPGLGYVSGRVRKIPEDILSAPPKLPHLGWNSITQARECPLLEGVDPKIGYYFLHSYYFDPTRPEDVLATTVFGREITCAVWHENVYGVQFHPEKSHANGVRLLRNFATMN